MTHRSAPLPPELTAWLMEQPPAERAALERAWAAAAPTGSLPAPDPARVEALWHRLEVATASPDLPDELASALAALPAEARAGLDEAWQMAIALPPPATPAPDPDRIEALWAALDPAPAPASTPTPRTRRSPTHRPSPAADRGPRTAARRAVRWMTGVAALLILAVAGVNLWLRPTTLEAPLGEVLTATLPDGSTVTLNSGTELEYDRHFGQTHRNLILRGEAFFEVTKSAQPFQVETFNAVVTVLGTEFNVRGWPDGGTRETMVSVVSGRVQVAPRMVDTAAVALTAGQIGWVQHETSPVLFTNADVQTQLAWLRGDFEFDRASLDAVFDEIERRFDVRITAPASIRTLRLSITKYRVTQPEALLDDICSALGLAYRTTPQGYEVYRP